MGVPRLCFDELSRVVRGGFYFFAEGTFDMSKPTGFRDITVIAALLCMMMLACVARAQNVKFDSDSISGLGARNIGSATMSGRVAAVAATKVDGRITIYVGSASGGVWKSLNGGATFKPVFDKEDAQSIGALAIDPQTPRTVWAGTGESWTRNSVSVGNGIYKSTDGGDTWTNMGLGDSERISKIIVDPKDGNTVYACVPGKLWSDSADRGLYRTSDGGKTWSLILKGPNLSTGCSMISMNAQEPKVLFAGMWDFRRKGWTFRSGGESPKAASGSGFFRTEDGGATWTELDEKSAKGLPAKPWGRVAVTIAPSKPNVVYALIESTRSALFNVRLRWGNRDRNDCAIEAERCVCADRVHAQRAFLLARRRKNLGRARPQQLDGLEAVLFCQFDCRSQEREQSLQAGPHADYERRW